MDALLQLGTVGVGKSTLAEAVSGLLEERGTVHAVLDLDDVRRLRPAPAGDPFQLEIELVNLAALAANFRAAGARLLVVAGVVETRAELARVLAAIGAERADVVRLVAEPAALQERLRGRHGDDPDGLAWHLDRTVVLTGILDDAALTERVLDTTGRTPRRLAEDLLRTSSVL